jgi:methylamine dehydrogenase accessory protein MauD
MVTRIVLAGVFIVAGLAKLADVGGSRRAAAEFGVPGRLAGAVGIGVPVVEIATAIALVPRTTGRWGAVAALVLLTVFAAAIANSLRAGAAPDCHCFGQLHSRPAGPATLIRNVVLAAAAAALVVAGPGSTLATVAPGVAAAIAGGVIAVVVVAAQWSLLLGLLRQNGRLLERVAALEARLPAPGGEVGSTAPALMLPNADGVPTALRPAHGERTLLVFTDPGCGPCNALLPEIGTWQRGDLNVAVIAGGTPAEARANREEHGIDTVLIDEERRAFAAFAIDGTPSGILLGADGRIAAPRARGAAAVRVLADRATGDAVGEPPSSWTLASGDRLPPLTLTDANGESVDLGAAGEHPRSLLFFDPHCPHCQGLLTALARTGTPPGLTIVVTRRTAPPELIDLGAQVLFDPTAQAMTMAGVDATPSLLALDEHAAIAAAPVIGGPAVLAAMAATREAVTR